MILVKDADGPFFLNLAHVERITQQGKCSERLIHFIIFYPDYYQEDSGVSPKQHIALKEKDAETFIQELTNQGVRI